MARPKRVEGAPQTADHILNAARAEFALHGAAARLEDIAERCGIRRASLLHHFSSKQQLLDALLAQVVEKARVRLLQAAEATAGDYMATIRGVTEALRQLEAEEQGVAAVLMHGLLDDSGRDALGQGLEQLVVLVTELAMTAGAGRHRRRDEVQAAVAHVLMGELGRLALGRDARRIWGEGDAVWPLISGFFLEPVQEVLP